MRWTLTVGLTTPMKTLTSEKLAHPEGETFTTRDQKDQKLTGEEQQGWYLRPQVYQAVSIR